MMPLYLRGIGMDEVRLDPWLRKGPFKLGRLVV